MPRIHASFFVVVIVSSSSFSFADDKIDYNRDVRPLLSNNCYKCHGPDAKERQTKFRLDTKKGAFSKLDSGLAVIAPGKSKTSAVYQRISSTDPDMRMPPADSGKTLTKKQIETIRKWIEQGAKWQGHWSFIRPQRAPLPKVKLTQWPKKPLDHFVLSRMEQEGLKPARQADKVTLIRRVTFDLIGLPPTPKQVDAFLADRSARAFEKVVDRLLRSPRYGEQMARIWLDGARYGDTHGLHLDNERSLWPYRDWVIRAMNRNQRFDRFTIEQLAGDLLPKPKLSQLVATGFNRCNVTTSEGGAIPEEWAVRYAIDRVETMSTVWMGLTVGCAVCHDHKFDPVSQVEFYQLYAFFNSVAERAMDGNALLPPPVIKVPTPSQRMEKQKLSQQLVQLQQQSARLFAKIGYKEPKNAPPIKKVVRKEVVWVDDNLPLGGQPNPAKWTYVTLPVFSGKRASAGTAKGLDQHFFQKASKPLVVGGGDKLFAYVYLDPSNPPKQIMLQFHSGNWEHRAIWGANKIPWGKFGTASRRRLGNLPATGKWVRLEVGVAQVGLNPGSKIDGFAFTQFDGTVFWDKAGIVSAVDQNRGREFKSLVRWTEYQRALGGGKLPKPVQVAIRKLARQRSQLERQRIRNHFLRFVYKPTSGRFAKIEKQIATFRSRQKAIDKAAPSTMIFRDRAKPKPAHVLVRGQYDKKGKSVVRQVPKILGLLPPKGKKNRLSLAKWLVDPGHPLTARVTVNRFWQHYFHVGIVKTSEDFGSQGEWPSHPKLLDWLATEFIRIGWDMKEFHKMIVLSATYQQSSAVGPALYRRDPENRLLARGPRHRLDAEVIRDNALAISGLLVNRIGGKGVKPYQPDGLWRAVGYSGSNTVKFRRDSGQRLYRRSLYTFWKRTAPPPTMWTFDAPSREACRVRRSTTNTPLQALLLLNDVQFIEAARHYGQRMIDSSKSDSGRISHGFRLATSRRPSAGEAKIFLRLLASHRAEFRKHPQAAKKLLSVGESKPKKGADLSELAAWTMIANLMLNLDETISRN